MLYRIEIGLETLQGVYRSSPSSSICTYGTSSKAFSCSRDKRTSCGGTGWLTAATALARPTKRSFRVAAPFRAPSSSGNHGRLYGLSCFCGWHADAEFGRRIAVVAAVWTPTTVVGFVIKHLRLLTTCWSIARLRGICWNVFTWAGCACSLGNDDELRERWEHLVAMQQPRRRKGTSTLFMIVAWHLWKEHNLRLSSNKPQSLVQS
jgi:hypothetical protein